MEKPFSPHDSLHLIQSMIDKILQFRPLVVGGIINWLLACTAVFFHFDYQMLFAAAAILISYLIPGYLIKPKQYE
jgi:predicted PurR-regulated permease PerM